MVVTSAASSMFSGITGLMGICMSVAAAVTTFTAPLFIHHFSYDLRVLVCFVANVLSFVICIIGSSVAGPAMGTMLAGFVYAFGTSLYLSAAAFYDQRTVIAFSTGSGEIFYPGTLKPLLTSLGFSAVFGPTLYIGFIQAFNGNWRHTILVFLPSAFIQPPVWYIMLSARNRTAAEDSRKAARVRDAKRLDCHLAARNQTANKDTATIKPTISVSNDLDYKTGFGPERTRIGLFWKTIFPQYVVPLLTCTCGAMFVLAGLAPTFGTLNTFKGAPSGALNYQLDFLLYGAAQFLLAGLAMFCKFPVIWFWALTQLFIVTMGTIQLFYPFMTYYGVWLIFMFGTGGIVGGGVTNTNYKIASDFQLRGESSDVRAFAMSYGGLGNFGGDVLGGGLAILVQRLAIEHLAARTYGGL